ncbi:hypothetical protein CLOSTASPAR_00710 [[Clostridium] asparagiforme DSM 15981]|uniref:Uncharacterized protein n=1 Tax=[Clostridium] asparagiforme DSM 15981 TaxID=518636 RepID=C0CUL8_9FIRM|nr:hypothetical protein CLOSTASPAR_00710 [[Clostridium] asparagiforme DSM 15981]
MEYKPESRLFLKMRSFRTEPFPDNCLLCLIFPALSTGFYNT